MATAELIMPPKAEQEQKKANERTPDPCIVVIFGAS